MKLTDSQREEIAEAIRQRCHGRLRDCPFCGHSNWVLVDGLVTLPLSDNLGTFQLGGAMMPLAALVCEQCGNASFFNILVLGLADLFESATGTRGVRRGE